MDVEQWIGVLYQKYFAFPWKIFDKICDDNGLNEDRQPKLCWGHRQFWHIPVTKSYLIVFDILYRWDLILNSRESSSRVGIFNYLFHMFVFNAILKVSSACFSMTLHETHTKAFEAIWRRKVMGFPMTFKS